MRAVLFFAAALFSLSAAAQPAPKMNEKALRVAFEDVLKDADSAKFRGLKYEDGDSSGSWTMCGDVNAKNSYGAYRGFEPFIGVVMRVGRNPVEYLIVEVGKDAGQICKSKGLRP